MTQSYKKLSAGPTAEAEVREQQVFHQNPPEPPGRDRMLQRRACTLSLHAHSSHTLLLRHGLCSTCRVRLHDGHEQLLWVAPWRPPPHTRRRVFECDDQAPRADAFHFGGKRSADGLLSAEPPLLTHGLRHRGAGR